MQESVPPLTSAETSIFSVNALKVAGDIEALQDRLVLTPEQELALQVILKQIKALGADQSSKVVVAKPEPTIRISKKKIAPEIPSRSPDLISGDGEVWIGSRAGEGSTSLVKIAVFRDNNGYAYEAVAKYYAPEGKRDRLQWDHPERLVVESEVLKLGIAGLPRYFTSGFQNDGRLCNSFPTEAGYPPRYPYVLVMEAMPNDGYFLKDDHRQYQYLYGQKEQNQRYAGSETHQEAVILAVLYYYLYVAAELVKNGWVVPYDYLLWGSNIVFDNNEGIFHAVDFGMTSPTTKDNATKLVDRLGGESIFHIMRSEYISNSDYEDPKRARRYQLEVNLQEGRTLEEFLAFIAQKRFDYRGDFLSQVIRLLIDAYLTSEASLDQKLSHLEGAKKPANYRLQHLLISVCQHPSSDLNLDGLKQALGEVLMSSPDIDQPLRQEILSLLRNTGIDDFDKVA